MTKLLQNLSEATSLNEVCNLLDLILQQVRDSNTKSQDRQKLLRELVFNPYLVDCLSNGQALDHLFNQVGPKEWQKFFGRDVRKELPTIMVDMVDRVSDAAHEIALRLAPQPHPKTLLAVLKKLNAYLEKQEPSDRYLRGMRVARIMADVYGLLGTKAEIWRRRTPPPCCLDNRAIKRLKTEKQIKRIAEAYTMRVNQLQRADLDLSLTSTDQSESRPVAMSQTDYATIFTVQAPLRLGISSANASDNYMRSKEQGGKTLNVAIDLQLESDKKPEPPLEVSARRLPEPHLILRSRSLDFKANLEISARGNAAAQSDLFFAYRRGGDEALQLVKQALVHTGIIADQSADILQDVTAFTGGGGLEITTRSKVMQGSGLGTSSILAATILKVLYRLSGHQLGGPKEYPRLYDQSLLLEQSIGLNSGWQDARGACGGPSAVKDFYAPPTSGLPMPRIRFIDGVDANLFTERIILFDTGIARAATRGLNVVLDTYLCRTPERYGAIRKSMEIHDLMTSALAANNYSKLGRLASRYWQLRCVLDPDATNASIRVLFEAPQITELTEGGLMTGAGGGGFALLIARPGLTAQIRKFLESLRETKEFANSTVVDYRLNPSGIRVMQDSS